MAVNTTEPKRILAVNLNYLGDALFTTPALAALRARFPDAEIDVLAGERAAMMLADDPAITRLLLRPRQGGARRATALRRTLAQGNYDTVILFQSTLSNALLTFIQGVPRRIGFAQDGCGPFLTHPVEERHRGEHIVDAYVRLSQALTDEPIAAQAAAHGLRIQISLEDMRFVEGFLQGYGIKKQSMIGLVIGATRAQKRWPEEYFARLADLLHSRIGATILLLGGPDESASAERIQEMCHVPLISAIGKTTEKQLAALSARLDAVVSGDSGPLHIATAVRTPVVALFGSTDPAETGPWQPPQGNRIPAVTLYDRLGCAPCRKSPTCGGSFDCLWVLTPDRVFDAVCTLIGAEPKPLRRIHLPMTASEDFTLSRPHYAEKPPRNVLVITKHHFMGDAIVTVPMLRAARQAFGDKTRITVLTGAAAATALEGCPYTDKIVAYNPKKEKGWLRQMRFLRDMDEETPDMCLVVDRSFRSAVLASATGAAVRAGFAVEYRSMLLTHPVSYKMDRREIECCLDVLRAVVPDGPGPRRYDPTPELWLSAEERRQGRDILQSVGAMNHRYLIGIQPGATFPIKQWATEHFAAVADALAEGQRDAAIVLIGGDKEIETAECMKKLVGVKTPIYDLTGKTRLRETMAVLPYLSLFISNDTGVAHIAAGIGAPTLTLFGPTIAHKWGNYGPYNTVIRAEGHDLNRLSAGQVIVAAQHILHKVIRDGELSEALVA